MQHACNVADNRRNHLSTWKVESRTVSLVAEWVFSSFVIYVTFISCSYVLFYMYLHELFYMCLHPIVGFSFPFISVYLYVALLI